MLNQISEKLRAVATVERAEGNRRYFKTGPGEYGEGDKFIGVTVPDLRRLAREFEATPLRDLRKLLTSEWHEERLLALLIMVRQYERGDQLTRDAIYDAYLRSTRHINNWDLVDASAPQIVGAHLLPKRRTALQQLAKSSSLWERRIAIVATFYFIRRGEFADTLQIAEMLLADTHDLIHKAVGWMLREVGSRDVTVLEGFLERHAAVMPRTTLRYAIEKFPEPRRALYLAARAKRETGNG
jgi:3-methyladenine DNA glycosylase AlkD